MRDAQPRTIYLKDYQAPVFLIKRTELLFQLYEDGAAVHATLNIERNPDQPSSEVSLQLDGEDLQLKSLRIDGRVLSESEYTLSPETLTIAQVPDRFVLETETWIKPQENKRLEGLYKSSSMFCTQCEAEGFRRITYYLDRPDVMSEFYTRIEADKAQYPLLLSNGNPLDQGDLEAGRHFVAWHDPFPKPCYLFALVAGDLHCESASFTTMSGREVSLQLFVEHKNADKCEFALNCLQQAMRWDEEKYGREYDLDLFMIVAVDDFNMGAMENKGLNIFNSSCVLAKPDAATDSTYQRIDAIVAHEYFHNWSGNRVTCRDWFQLSLKEGFTVFRDACYSADMTSETVKRIEDVNLLRTAQFAEDAGPMSHPVRPASYMEIGNFYTLTVYEKGAEVVGMLRTLLGEDRFRQGSDLYFARHDGQAVTTDDFVAAMEAVSGRDLAQFKRWYDQSGTPRVQVTSHYDEAAKCYTLHFQQSCPATPGQSAKQPYHMPINLALLGVDGQALSLSTLQVEGAEGMASTNDESLVFELREAQQSLRFEHVDQRPVPSLLRGFSAPVKLSYDYQDEELLFLMQHDQDGFNRWDAGQQYATRLIQGIVADIQAGQVMRVPYQFIESYGRLLAAAGSDRAMMAKMLMLPSEQYLIELATEADVEAIHAAREFVRKALAEALHDDLLATYHANHRQAEPPDLGYAAMSERMLKNTVLSLLSSNGAPAVLDLAKQQFSAANNMTDSYAALACLVNSGDAVAAKTALSEFYQRWQDDAQVLDQWFAVQASSDVLCDLSYVRELMSHSAFALSNPNKVRSVVGVFCNQNLLNFHAANGEGYAFLADVVLSLDDLNPQIASRLMTPLTRWRKFSAARQALMTEQLQRIKAKAGLSKDVTEVVIKSLAD